MQLSQICDQVNGQLCGADVVLNNVSINTRADCKDRLFVALKGDNFDAHDYVHDAEQAGAAALMVERAVATDLPCVVVASTHRALCDLAAWWRSQFVMPVVGVTGSVGKTTVKEMLRAIFAELGQGVVTQGNLNNEIGVPLTLMDLATEDQYAIVEMGMNHAGEISRLSNLVKPTVAVINNAAAAHLEGLGTIDAVAKAKGEIFDGLSDDAVAIINQDDVYCEFWRNLVAEHKVVTFGLSKDADVFAEFCQHEGCLKLTVSALGNEFKVQLPAVGKHSVSNALAAIAVSMVADIPIEKIKSGLQKFKPANGRLNIVHYAHASIIDDSYNANPASMQAAIDVLAQYNDTTLIVGDMAELGSSAALQHRKLGELAKSSGIDALFVCGEFSEQVANGFGEGANRFAQQSDLIDHLLQSPPKGVALVKGSRSAKMERVVIALSKYYQALNAQPQDLNRVVTKPRGA